MEEKPQQETIQTIQVEATPKEEAPIVPKEDVKKKPRFIIGLVALVVIFFGTTIFFANQSFQMVRQKAIQSQPTISPNVPTPTVTTPITETTTKPHTVYENSFNYHNFTIGYPDSWILLEMSANEDFPIKERLFSLYNSDKVVAINKNGVYLITIIMEQSDGEVGGIFIDDEHYNEFISDKDKVVIGSSTFYLSRTCQAIPILLESHSGPAAWSSLTEYISNKTVQSGEVFKGFENMIKRNGYAYNFIVVCEKGGQTPQELQSEIITILQSIDW